MERNLIKSKFVERLQWRIHNDYDCFIPIVGKRGIGKSSLMIWLMMYCDPNFSMDNVVWLPIETFKKLTSMPAGTAIGIDEIGNLWSNRRHAEAMNKIFNETIQSNRFKRHYVFVTCPSLSDLDIGGRKMADHFIEVRMRGSAVVFENWINLKTGERGQNTWGTLEFPRLPRDVEDAYITRKSDVENKRYVVRLKKLKELEARERDVKESPVIRGLREVRKNPTEYITDRKVDARYLAAKLGISDNSAYKVKKLIERDEMDHIVTYIK